MGTKGRVWVTIGTHKCDAKSLVDFKATTVPSSSGFKRSYLLSSLDSPDMQVLISHLDSQYRAKTSAFLALWVMVLTGVIISLCRVQKRFSSPKSTQGNSIVVISLRVKLGLFCPNTSLFKPTRTKPVAYLMTPISTISHDNSHSHTQQRMLGKARL